MTIYNNDDEFSRKEMEFFERLANSKELRRTFDRERALTASEEHLPNKSIWKFATDDVENRRAPQYHPDFIRHITLCERCHSRQLFFAKASNWLKGVLELPEAVIERGLQALEKISLVPDPSYSLRMRTSDDLTMGAPLSESIDEKKTLDIGVNFEIGPRLEIFRGEVSILDPNLGSKRLMRFINFAKSNGFYYLTIFLDKDMKMSFQEDPEEVADLPVDIPLPPDTTTIIVVLSRDQDRLVEACRAYVSGEQLDGPSSEPPFWVVYPQIIQR